MDIRTLWVYIILYMNTYIYIFFIYINIVISRHKVHKSMPGLILNCVSARSPGKLSLDINIMISFLSSLEFFYITVITNVELGDLLGASFETSLYWTTTMDAEREL